GLGVAEIPVVHEVRVGGIPGAEQAVLEADLEAGVGAVAVAHHEIDRLVGGNRIAERVERRQAVGGLGGGRRSGRQRHGGRRDRRRIRQRAGDLRAGRAGGVYLQRQQGVGRAVQAQGQQAVRVERKSGG